jgi:hypothetical protein
MDPKDINQTNFCNKKADNIISNQLKQYILEDIKNRTGLNYNSKYARILHPQYEKNLKNPHIACLKTSGSPYFLFFTKINKINYCLMIDKKINTGHSFPKMFIVKLNITDDDIYTGSLFETELLRDKSNNWQLLISDAYYYKNSNVNKNKNIIDRLNFIYEMMDNYDKQNTDMCDICVKKYFEISDTDNIFTTFVPTLNYNIRGIYFIPINLNYSNLLHLIKQTDTFAKKDKKNLNFKIVKDPHLPEIFDLYLRNNDGLEKIDIALINTLNTSKKVNDYFKENNIGDIICECSYNKQFKKWTPVNKTDKLVDHIKDLELIV